MAGGSEATENAGEAFRRRYWFSPFNKPSELPAHMFEGVYVACSGLLQKRDTNRGPYIQIQQYLDAKVPIIILEHVPECRKKPGQQSPSPNDLQTTAVQHMEAAEYQVPRGEDGHPGQLLASTDFGGATGFGGVVNRPRLFTIAICPEVWARPGQYFQ